MYENVCELVKAEYSLFTRYTLRKRVNSPMNELYIWSWVFLISYVALMIGIGIYASRRISDGDDYAVARAAYGPLVLALAFAATTASGATFLGLPALTYSLGLPAMWYPILYPIGTYIGVLCCLRVVSSGGQKLGNRSIPEYLGDRYQSDFIRLAYALFSLILVFYLAGQLVAGLVMFERLLGLPDHWALILTTLVLLIYVSLGGAHADILSDGVQGVAMLLIALLTVFLFVRGIQVDNEWVPVIKVLAEQSKDLVQPMKPGHLIFGSPWTIFLLTLAHVPLGMLPHIGNKLWALKSAQDRRRFLSLAFIFAMILPCMALGGLMSRALFGDQLLMPGFSANEAVPALFIEIMPAWLAALLCIAILSAVMSTADGLVVSASQVFANDIYRRSIAPRWQHHLTARQIEARVLMISRYATVVILLGSAALAWGLMDINVALIVWIGIGGMTSALAGPLLLGSLWSSVNKAGAIAGMLVGAFGFIFLHTGLITSLLNLPEDAWLSLQARNSFTCSGLGIIASVIATVILTLLTRNQNPA